MFTITQGTWFRSLLSLALIGSLLIARPSHGEIIHQRMQNGLLASAEYLDGKSNDPPILILHGFLQTRDFFTVRRIADALHEDGHSVLLPNLSLGIEQRSQSLACEAIHTHSMEQDRDEIALWVDWLSRRTAQPVTLIGHSIGSLTLLAYLDAYPDSAIDKTILVSLIAFVQGPIAKETPQDKRRAEYDLRRNKRAIRNYRLAYCDRYSTTPDNYLSYLNWDEPQVVDALVGLAQKPSIILGSKDHRLSPAWKPTLQAIKADVIEIEGANHFFDHSHEFDLLDMITELL